MLQRMPLTPLCPAGYLPHRWGDRKTRYRRFILDR